MPTYVQIARCNAKEVFETKYKDQLLKGAEQAMRAAIKGSLTSAKPTDKSAKGYSLTLNLSLTLDSGTKMLTGKCDMLINIWPKDLLHKSVMGKAGTLVDPAKVDKGDVTFVIDAMMKQTLKTALPTLQAPPP
jgi:hypothetical protein